VDLGSFAALTGAELAASVSTAPPAGAPLAVVPAAEPAAPADPAIAAELPKPFAAFSRSATAMLDALTARARSQLGTRYVLGASSPGGALDCSAFTRFAMEALGLRLPRTAAQQAKVGVAVPRDRERLRPGDLLTFGSRRRVSHVGIYLGEGRFIHASVTSGQVIETTFAKNARLLRRWLGARRLLAGADSMPTTGG
jgi:cell wall-associated NlpC family hydrolase